MRNHCLANRCLGNHCLRNFRGVLLLFPVLVLGFNGLVSGQTTVQLPSFSRFTYSGSVLVPTGGSTSLGGVSRSSSGVSSRGFGGGSALGGSMSHSGARAHVTIIDNDAIDRQIRGLPPKGSTRPAVQPSAAKRSATVDPDAEGKILVRYARKKYLEGNRSSAFNAYGLAIKSLSPQLAALAKAEFRRVFPSGQRPSTLESRPIAADVALGRDD